MMKKLTSQLQLVSRLSVPPGATGTRYWKEARLATVHSHGRFSGNIQSSTISLKALWSRLSHLGSKSTWNWVLWVGWNTDLIHFFSIWKPNCPGTINCKDRPFPAFLHWHVCCTSCVYVNGSFSELSNLPYWPTFLTLHQEHNVLFMKAFYFDIW